MQCGSNKGKAINERTCLHAQLAWDTQADMIQPALVFECSDCRGRAPQD
jgi:hypothetical protein